MKRFAIGLAAFMLVSWMPVNAQMTEFAWTPLADISGQGAVGQEVDTEGDGYYVRYWRTIGTDLFRGEQKRNRNLVAWDLGVDLERLQADIENSSGDPIDIGAYCMDATVRFRAGHPRVHIYGGGGVGWVVSDREAVTSEVVVPGDSDSISRGKTNTTESEDVVGEVETAEQNNSIRWIAFGGIRATFGDLMSGFAEVYTSDSLSEGTLVDENTGVRVGIGFKVGS